MRAPAVNLFMPAVGDPEGKPVVLNLGPDVHWHMTADEAEALARDLKDSARVSRNLLHDRNNPTYDPNAEPF